MSDSAPAEKKKPIRSYVIRSGRLTDAQRKAIESFLETYVIEFNNTPLDLAALFEKPQKLTVEIGFGMGDSLLEMAKQSPDQNFLGIEVHQPGVGKLLNGIAENQLSNIKLICHDAREILEAGLPEHCIDRLLLFFPDPWPKPRQRQRRLVRTDLLETIIGLMAVGGHLRIATDVDDYAEQIVEVCGAEPRLEGGPVPRPLERPITRFELKGLEAGRTVTDFSYRVRGDGDGGHR